MRTLQVDPAGLHLLAGQCRAWSAELAGTPPPDPATPGWATAVAADAVHAVICAVSEDLAQRLRQTATMLDSAAHGFRTAEDDSATALGRPAG